MHTMKDLMKLDRNDSVVHAVMTHWLNDGYPSSEAMLIDLVCILAKCRHDLTDRLHKATMYQPAPIVVPASDLGRNFRSIGPMGPHEGADEDREDM